LLLAIGFIAWAKYENYLPLTILCSCGSAVEFAAAALGVVNKRWPLAFSFTVKRRGGITYPVIVMTLVDAPSTHSFPIKIDPPDNEGPRAIDN
jgi:hypothetical protein